MAKLTLPKSARSSQFEDWSNDYDDAEASFWEFYLGGPEDQDVVQEYRGIEIDLAEQVDFDRGVVSVRTKVDKQQVRLSGAPSEPVGSETDQGRQAKIVHWLSTSKFALDFKTGTGFYVRKGPHVRLLNGVRFELLDWLRNEGIAAGCSIAGYNITYTRPDTPYGEKMSFFRVNSEEQTSHGSQHRWESPSPSRQMLNQASNLPDRAYATWNKDEDSELTVLYRKGLSQRQLAQHFSRQSSAVRSRLRKLGLR